MDNYKNLGR